MDAADKRMLEREALRNMIQQWNANRLDLFELSEPNENLEFHGVMRFYFQDSGQKIATKCIRVASDATVSDVIETLIEKFRPDMRMLSLGSYSLWETHGPDDERRLEPHEKPLLVQLNWHADDREGRFLLKCLTNNEVPISAANDKGDQNFKRKLSKREKKELKKKEKLSRLKSDTNDENRPVAEKLYTELPETSFTRSISNPEAVMRRRRQQKLERKLQQFRSKDGGPDTGGTLKIYGSSLCPDVPYKTLLVSVRDSAAGVLREMLDKYGLARHEPRHYCLVQVDTRDNSEYVLEDDECPLAIVMTHHNRGSIMFHVRRRPADTQPRRRKKKAGSSVSSGGRPGNDPALVEVAPDGSNVENGRRLRITDVVEVGSGNGTALQLYGPSIQSRHCVIAPAEGGGYTVTPLHTDAHVYVNGRRTMHSQRLQHGCLLKFGRVSTFRFVDPAQETILNRNLSQSQHFGSGSIYDRSPTSAESGALSPTSMTSHQPDLVDSNANTTNDTDYNRTMSPVSHDAYYNQNDTPYNNNTLKLDNESLMMSQHLNDTKDDYREEQSMYNEQEQAQNRTTGSQYKDNYETTFDLEGNVETKSICSAKSGGSGHDNSRMGMGTLSSARPGAEAILPAVLEFPEAGQPQFLAHVITRLDPHAPAFKLAPVYTLYLCARYRASTHYRPELTPTERAHKLTAFLHHVATLIHTTVQERCTDSAAQAFWMANASELLHFLKCDRHISSFSTQAQDLLPSTVQNAFSNLVSCFQEELSRALSTLTNPAVGDPNEATGPTVQVLASAMVLLRRCRVNAALTIQLFSHLFHYINAVCFNKLVTEPGAVSGRWGSALAARLALLAAWAERQGLELAADCHLARTHQAARLIQGSYRTAEEARAALSACFKLNSVQVRALLSATSSADVVQAAVAHARALADELCRADGREIRLEESTWLGAALLIPGDGFSAEVVRGVPPGLAEFVAPLQRGGLCRLAHQPHAVGVWTVYLAGYGMPRRTPDPRVQVIQLHKNANGMGLSIVAAKGAGQSKLGIYIKSVVPGGAAALDGRLAAGDQLLSVDGQSLRGITQEKAAEYLVRTGPTVTLEIAKQGAVLHGLATLLHQPATTPEHKPESELELEIEYEHRGRRNSGTFTNTHPAMLRPASPLAELATAGYGRRPCHDRCQILRDESTESSTDDSEDFTPHYHGSIPRLIITLDRENNQLHDDMSPDTPGCPFELKCGPPQPPRPIPVFTFTCEDFDEQHPSSDTTTYDSHVPPEEDVPPKVPEPPANYESSENEVICLPPQMKPIDTKLTLDLFNMRPRDDFHRRRCTGIDECVSACECCRTPQPETQSIPFIDEPNSEPVIYENDTVCDKVATPKIRRILPSLSLDKPEEKKTETADAVCQTPCSPMEETKPVPIPAPRRLDLNVNIPRETQRIDGIQCRLKRALFNMSQSYSSKSEDTDGATYSTSESNEDTDKRLPGQKSLAHNTPIESGAKQILDSVDRKSWKSPDEYRPSYGKVKALAKHFNDINLSYSVMSYKRNCQSSPNLSARNEKSFKILDNVHSTSLADIQYESNKTDLSEARGGKMSEEEVKSILIQLEDWSKYGSRGSEDTLAQGNEFELPNLPSEDHTDNNAVNGYVFNEIVDKKPKIITLDNIRIKSTQSSFNSDQKSSNSAENQPLRSRFRAPPSDGYSLLDVSNSSRRESYSTVVQSCPNVSSGSARGRRACAGGNLHHSCPSLAPRPADSKTDPHPA
ncbi:afadin isoform X4 [Plodia interpunctella]|uniref:afadin isoform X4 n=1 Tax=Plodia interpunctella TaxID=58824 RepID=UPI002368EE09|nr:afadin isoform X4 [Plodia interpunctella]